MIEENHPTPDKTSILIEPMEIQTFFKNKSCFKLSKQKVLYRVWLEKDGGKKALVVVGKDEFRKLVSEAHKNPTSNIRHVGMRKTFNELSKRYYSFEGRKTTNAVIAGCGICQMNNYPRTNAVKSGNQISMHPNFVGLMDACGPLKGFAQSSSGTARYLLVYIDSMTRFTIVQVATTTTDKDVLKCLKKVRETICGMPQRIMVDNALITDRSESLKFCKEHGTEVVHGLPFVSRSQAKVERVIQSIMRLVCKLNTENENVPFESIVAEACVIYNSSPSDGLGGRWSPKEVFFNQPTSNFPYITPLARCEDPRTEARKASRQAVLEEVKRYMKNQMKNSPSDFTNKIKKGTLALKKRTSFPTHSPRKLAYKMHVQGFVVGERAATNAYICKDIKSGKTEIIPGDHLVTVNALDESGLRSLIEEMETIILRNEVEAEITRNEPGGGSNNGEAQGDVAESRRRRSRRLQGLVPELEDPRLNEIF